MKSTISMDDAILSDHVTVMCPKLAVEVLQHKCSYGHDRLYLESCRSAQTFSTCHHKLEIQTSYHQFYRITRPPKLGLTPIVCLIIIVNIIFSGYFKYYFSLPMVISFSL